MAQRKSPSYPEWPVDRSVYSLFCAQHSLYYVRDASRSTLKPSTAVNKLHSLRNTLLLSRFITRTIIARRKMDNYYPSLPEEYSKAPFSPRNLAPFKITQQENYRVSQRMAAETEGGFAELHRITKLHNTVITGRGVQLRFSQDTLRYQTIPLMPRQRSCVGERCKRPTLSLIYPQNYSA